MKRVKTTGWSTFRKSMLFLMFVSVMTFTSIPGYSQTKKNVTGIVKDAETGEPLIGVGIKVKDINYGVITDLDGKYSIDLEEGQDVLIYTYIGYETQKVEVGNKTIINIALKTDQTALEGVVVVGYGKQKKSMMVSSVQTIEPDDLKMPSASLNRICRKIGWCHCCTEKRTAWSRSGGFLDPRYLHVRFSYKPTYNS